HLLDRLAVWHARGPKTPVRRFFADIRRRTAFVIAVIPFAEIGFDLRHIAISRQPARFASARERARENKSKLSRGKRTAQRYRLVAAHFAERQIGPARVGAGAAPLCLAVPHQPELSRHSDTPRS